MGEIGRKLKFTVFRGRVSPGPESFFRPRRHTRRRRLAGVLSEPEVASATAAAVWRGISNGCLHNQSGERRYRDYHDARHSDLNPDTKA